MRLPPRGRFPSPYRQVHPENQGPPEPDSSESAPATSEPGASDQLHGRPGLCARSGACPLVQCNHRPGWRRHGGTSSRNEELYKIVTNVNQVLVPVMVKDDSGRLVNGLLARDFSVFEDGKNKI